LIASSRGTVATDIGREADEPPPGGCVTALSGVAIENVRPRGKSSSGWRGLGLTESQHGEVTAIFERMSAAAKLLGGELIVRERTLDQLFANR
jgi:hypothetical protein